MKVENFNFIKWIFTLVFLNLYSMIKLTYKIFHTFLLWCKIYTIKE